MKRSPLRATTGPHARGTGPRARSALTTGVLAVLAVAATATVAGCSSASGTDASSAAAGHARAGASASAPASPSPRGSAAAGPIRITGAYLPQPASPDVAAVYFTVADTGPTADVLLSATSTPAAQAALMRESDAGGAESMTALAGGLPIPAHGQVTLAPGGYHLMLTDPAAPLRQGGTVAITLRFEHAGTVTVEVPVTSLLSDALTGPGSGSSPSPMAGMPGM